MTLRPSLAVPLLLALTAPACGAFYPRFTTASRQAPPGLAESGELPPPPDTVHRIAVLGAEIPRQTRDGRDWDGDGGPDPYVVIFRNGTEVYRTRTLQNTARPEWDPQRDHVDLYVTERDELRVELREDDGMSSEPVGFATSRGVPSEARNGGNWNVRLEGGATLQLRSTPPPARLGMGVTFEYRDDALVVVAIEQASPANTAGLRVGDRITAIGGRSISTLGELGSRQGMDRGGVEDVTLTVQRDRRQEEIVVRRGVIYPTQ